MSGRRCRFESPSWIGSRHRVSTLASSYHDHGFCRCTAVFQVSPAYIRPSDDGQAQYYCVVGDESANGTVAADPKQCVTDIFRDLLKHLEGTDLTPKQEALIRKVLDRGGLKATATEGSSTQPTLQPPALSPKDRRFERRTYGRQYVGDCCQRLVQKRGATPAFQGTYRDSKAHTGIRLQDKRVLYKAGTLDCTDPGSSLYVSSTNLLVAVLYFCSRSHSTLSQRYLSSFS